MTGWVVAAALAALLAALELRRPNRRNLAVRIVAVMVAVAALFLLLDPPRLPANPGPGGVAVLLTPGADALARRHLADSLPGVPQVASPDSAPDLDALRRRYPDLRTVVVAGFGLRASMLARHGDLEIVRYPATSPDGLIHLAWTKEVTIGDPVTVTARLEPAPRPRLVRFEGPAGGRDSVRVAADSTGPVSFRTTPAAVGVARVVMQFGDAAPDTLGVMVHPARTVAVLILDGHPAFETSFLRRWLAGQGAAVAVRTTISRGRDRIDRVNVPEQRLRPLTAELLDRFDLVRLDGPSLSALSPAERGALDAAIQTRGLGLLVTPDSLARRDPDFFPFRVSATGDIEDRLVRPHWPGRTDRSTTPVPTAAESIEPAPALMTLMRDPVGRILAAAVRRGAGAIGTTVVLAPSRWLLEEEPAPFAGYWSALLEATARQRGDRWSLLSDGPVVPGLPVTLLLETDADIPAATVATPGGPADTLGLVQDLTDPFRWWGRFWPAEPGVYTATNRSGEPYQFVVEQMAGSGREAAARNQATSWWAEASRSVPNAPHDERRQPLRPFGPFVLLVLSLGVLWSETRAVSFFTSNT